MCNVLILLVMCINVYYIIINVCVLLMCNVSNESINVNIVCNVY